MTLKLTVAVTLYDRTRPFLDGRVTIEGCDSTVIEVEPEEMFHRALHFEEFDVTELSFSNYLTMTADGDCPYIAIPAFPARKFRHSGVFINKRSGIRKPKDLKGKRVGTPEYQVTAVTWVRGVLEDEYGVKPNDVDWRWGGLEQAGRTQKTHFVPPKGLSLEAIPAGKTLQQMLADNELDAVIAPRSPTCYVKGHPDVTRLWPDFIKTEQDYFRNSGIFPIMHLVGIHKKLVTENKWLPDSVFKAFEQAKAMAYQEVAYDNSPRATNPWMEAYTAQAKALMGDDFWPYGLDENRKTVEAFLRYHFDQGLASRRLAAEEIFVPSTLERSRI
jgi:4,5-dihydroxyphthalate decarboxylase